MAEEVVEAGDEQLGVMPVSEQDQRLDPGKRIPLRPRAGEPGAPRQLDDLFGVSRDLALAVKLSELADDGVVGADNAFRRQAGPAPPKVVQRDRQRALGIAAMVKGRYEDVVGLDDHRLVTGCFGDVDGFAGPGEGLVRLLRDDLVEGLVGQRFRSDTRGWGLWDQSERSGDDLLTAVPLIEKSVEVPQVEPGLGLPEGIDARELERRPPKQFDGSIDVTGVFRRERRFREQARVIRRGRFGRAVDGVPQPERSIEVDLSVGGGTDLQCGPTGRHRRCQRLRLIAGGRPVPSNLPQPPRAVTGEAPRQAGVEERTL